MLLASIGHSQETGKGAAMKYFVPNESQSSVKSGKSVVSRGPAQANMETENLLGLSVGSLLNSKSYGWLDEETSGWSVEAQYLSQGEDYISRGYHFELQKFSSKERELTKLSFLVSFNFPRRLSFPVYLGVAAGPSYFVQQLKGSSEFALDYRAYAGLRLSGTYGQYFLQSGVKNHVHVLDSGQFIGWFFSSGVAYKF